MVTLNLKAFKLSKLKEILEYIENNDFDGFKIIDSESIIVKNNAIMKAAELGRSEMVSFLLSYPELDPTFHDNYAFRRAVRNNHTKTAVILLNDKRVDPSDAGNYALVVSASQDLFDIIHLLLKDERVDPSHNNNDVIIHAYNQNQQKLVDILWCDKRVKNTLKHTCNPLFKLLIERDLKNKIKSF